MSLLRRQFNPSSIEYGFNGKWNEVETGYQNYGMRDYGARARRFTRIDPISRNYPWYTPYQFAGNKPIAAIDLDGLEDWMATQANLMHQKVQLEMKVSALKQQAQTWQPPTNTAVFKADYRSTTEIKADQQKVEYYQTLHRVYNTDEGVSFQIVTGIGEAALAYSPELATAYGVGHGFATKNKAEVGISLFTYGLGKTFSILEKTNEAAPAFGSVRTPMSSQQATEFLNDALRMYEQPLNSSPKSFEDLIKKPEAIWGKSADQVEKILGKGWTKEPLNSGSGWKFTSKDDGGFVSYTTGNSHHPNSEYYKINSGSAGKIKVVGEGYVSTANDKSKIIKAN